MSIRFARFAFGAARRSNTTSLSRVRRGGGGMPEGLGSSFARYGLEEAAEDFALTKAFGFDDAAWEKLFDEIIRSKVDLAANPGQEIILRDEFVTKSINYCKSRGKDFNPPDYVRYLESNIREDKFDAIDIIAEDTGEELGEAFESIYGNYGLSFALGGLIGRSRGRVMSRFAEAKAYGDRLRRMSDLNNYFSTEYTAGRKYSSNSEALAAYQGQAIKNYARQNNISLTKASREWNTNAASVQRSRETATRHLTRMGYASGLTVAAKNRINESRQQVNNLGYRP
jgi:hypothetical protein